MDARPTHAPLPLILLPGMDGTGRLFASLVRELSSAFEPRPVSYPTQDVRTYAQLEDAVSSACAADRSFAILAESFSGPLALRIAAGRPAGLVAVVLVATFVVSPVAGAWAAPLVGAWLFRAPPSVSMLRHVLLGSDAPDCLVGEVAAAIRSVSPDVLAARAREVLRVDATEALRHCRVPLLYLAGARDRLVRRGVAESMRRDNAAMQIEVLDAPHLVLQCAPRQAADAIDRFRGRFGSNGHASGSRPC